MNSAAEAFEFFARRGLAILLVPSALLFALMLVGIGNATTDATPAQLYISAAVYLGLTLLCIVTAFRAERLWIGWLSVAIGWAPVLYVARPFVG